MTRSSIRRTRREWSLHSGHEHNGSEPMLVAPCRKHLAVTFGSSVGSGDLYDIRHAKPP
jgi:hypothetical protein